MSALHHLDGHLSYDNLLSPQNKYRDLPLAARIFADASLDDLWQGDTARLPGGLARLRRQARSFAQQYLEPLSADLDLAAHLAPGQCPPQVRQLLVQAGKDGWLSYFLPKPLGSLSWSAALQPPIWACSLVVEEFSRACGGLMLLLSAHHLGCMPLLMSGNLSVIKDFLLPVYRSNQQGDPHLVAFAITEPQAGSDVEEGHGAQRYRPGVVATPVQGGYLLNGRKCYISGGDLARSMTVFAALKGEDMASWTCFYVDCASQGVRIPRTELKMGMRASGAAEVEFDNVFLPNERIVGGLRKGWVLNRLTLNSSRIPVASMGVGFARAATETAIEFARRYTLAGKALIHYQEVQLHLATMVAETRAIRSLVWQEARHARKPRQLHASLCKFQATDRAQHVCEMAMDLLADHGALHEQRIERIFRDVRLTRIFEGTNQINRLSLIEDWQGQLLDNANQVGV
ncbi:acyl-CoA dehydrogenase [Herbaspirillum rubrisubalbicans]|uniref:acyl-CoA dehydrogenase family protein n=1 Tax=Herbaspirillum rubrisubalbicans TaxID=80842 RepID=UPI000DC56ED1|nr:acyl-CoA dehydrogenase family protein [Herbaspirillum rubrisubalbicans]RAN45195.1 acyl-CoA dehydrogenase [Herbaspirillum rubrisubalbicans]